MTLNEKTLKKENIIFKIISRQLKKSKEKKIDALIRMNGWMNSEMNPPHIDCLFTHMKNCEPLVFLPRLAIDNKNGLSCLRSNDSSENGK